MARNDSGEFETILTKGRLDCSIVSNIDSNRIVQVPGEVSSENPLYPLGCRFVFDIKYREEVFGIICLGSKISEEAATPEELHYARLVCSIAANSLQNARARNRLKDEIAAAQKRNQLLATLFEMSRDFSELLTKPEIVKALSYHLMGQLMVSRFALMLKNERGDYSIEINKFPNELKQCALGEIENIKSTLVIDSQACENCLNELYHIGARILSPMTAQGEIKGLMIIGKKMTGEAFTDENLQYISALGARAMSSLENERLFKETLEKRRIESEMELARSIQLDLLPSETPRLRHYDVAGETKPSRWVGGDYFDFFKTSEGLLFVIADVAGKGMPAALIMANAQAAFRLLAPLNVPIKDMVIRINKILFENTAPDKFVTFFVGSLNERTRTLQYVNAGHNPPLLIKSSGDALKLEEGGLILGFLDDYEDYSVGEAVVDRGDCLLLFTDGVTEANDPSGEEYGDERLTKLFAYIRRRPSKEIIETIFDSVEKYAGDAPQYDDITAIAIKCIV